MPCDVGHALDVDVDHRVELRRRHIDEVGGAVDDRRVVDEQGGRAVLGERAPGPVGDGAVVGDVHRREVVRLAKSGLQLGDLVGGAAAADDLVAQPDKLPGQAAADAAGHAGDDNGLGHRLARLRLDRL